MTKYKVRVDVYVTRDVPHWVVEQTLRHRVVEMNQAEHVEMTKFFFHHVSAGDNNCFYVTYKIKAGSKACAEQVASWITDARHIDQAYVRTTNKEPRIEIKIKAETVRGTSVSRYQVIAKGLLDSFRYNNQQELETFFNRRFGQIATNGLVSWELTQDLKGWRQWIMLVMVTAGDEYMAKRLVHRWFNANIWREFDTTHAIKDSPWRGVTVADIEENTLELWNLDVNVVVLRDLGYVEKRAAAILDRCDGVEDWEIVESRSEYGRTSMDLFVRYHASTMARAKEEIIRTLKAEAYVDDYNVCAHRLKPACAKNWVFTLKDDTAVRIEEVDPGGRVHCSVQCGDIEYGIEFKTQGDFHAYVETRGIKTTQYVTPDGKGGWNVKCKSHV